MVYSVLYTYVTTLMLRSNAPVKRYSLVRTNIYPDLPEYSQLQMSTNIVRKVPVQESQYKLK